MARGTTTDVTTCNEAEMAAVSRLAAQWVKWQKKYPSTVGESLAHLMLVVRTVDRHVVGVTDLTVARSMAVDKLTELLATKPSSSTAQLFQALKPKLKGIPKADPASREYLLRTVKLLADEFPSWLKEVGLGGFFSSLVQLEKVYAEVFEAAIYEPKVERSSVEFLTAFELRAHFGLAERELEALKYLSAEGETSGAGSQAAA